MSWQNTVDKDELVCCMVDQEEDIEILQGPANTSSLFLTHVETLHMHTHTYEHTHDHPHPHM